MKRIAMIKDNVVENISFWDLQTDWNPGPEYTLFDITDIDCNIGDLYDSAKMQIIKENKSKLSLPEEKLIIIEDPV